MIALLVVALLAMAALAGCGGGDGDETSSVTKAQFRKEADAICAKAGEAKEKAVAAAFNSRNLDELPKDEKVQEELVLEVLVPIEKMTEELAALEAPEGAEDQVTEMVASYEEGVEQVKDEPLDAVQENYDAFGKASGRAGALGLQTCKNVR